MAIINNDLYGLYGNDTLLGYDGYDRLYGNAGNDWLDGGNGNDFLYGGTGNDTLIGGAHTDVLQGEQGADWLWGGDGTDVMWGGTEQDHLFGGTGTDVYGFNYGDSFAFTGSADIIWDWESHDFIQGPEGGYSAFGANVTRIEDAASYANTYQANGWLPANTNSVFIYNSQTETHFLMDLDNDVNNTFNPASFSPVRAVTGRGPGAIDLVIGTAVGARDGLHSISSLHVNNGRTWSCPAVITSGLYDGTSPSSPARRLF